MFDYIVNIPTYHAVQLGVALSGGIVLFLFAYFGGSRFIFKAIVLLIPFQLIESRYGSLNMAITYILGIAMLFNRSWFNDEAKEKWPLLYLFLLILGAYLISWTQAPPAYLKKTAIYLVMLSSNILLFYLTYRFIRIKTDVVELFNLLFLCNVLVIIYCLVTVIMIGKNTALFGIDEFRLNEIDPRRMRIVGPFVSVGTTAEYLVIQCCLILYAYQNQELFKRSFLSFLFVSNFFILFGTGNRGGMLSLVFSFILFSIFYRRVLGTIKLIGILVGLFVVLGFSSLIMIKYSDYNVVFDRLRNTEIKGFTPDTRERDWLAVLGRIPNKPVIGHGPRIVIEKELRGSRSRPRNQIHFYPHNLYLFVLYTMGAVGFSVFVLLGARFFRILMRMKKNLADHPDPFFSRLPIIGIIIFLVFLFDQMKIEFLRHNLLDYQHYISVIFGMFCAVLKFEHPGHDFRADMASAANPNGVDYSTGSLATRQ